MNGECGAISFESAIGIGVLILLAMSSIQDLGSKLSAEYTDFGAAVAADNVDNVCVKCDSGGGEKNNNRPRRK